MSSDGARDGGVAEGAQGAEEAAALLAVGGLLEFGGHGVEEGAVAELGGGGERGIHHVGVDAFARLQPFGGEAAGFVAERGVVALRGDEGHDAGALEGDIGVFAGLGGPAEAAGAVAESRLDEARVIG